MRNPLRILHLEDDPASAALVQATLELEGIGCATTRVVDETAFVAALGRGGIDLVLSDIMLPGYDGLEAAELVHTKYPGLPVILISGARETTLATDSLRSGATDHVPKTDLAQLAPAVRRAMLEVDARVARASLETQLIEAQKMEVIGQLAGGVAHDFNNILAVIMGYTDMLTADLGPDSPLLEYTGEISTASQRAVALTQQLLLFSRKETAQPVVLDVNAVLQDLDKMLRRLVDENIAMTIVPGTRIGCIRADAGYVGQVLMNLVVNARDAMPNGGTLTISTHNVAYDGSTAGITRGAAAGDSVLLSVTDTGTGMTEDVKAHLFEAFFTTKPKGKGTGLGLATCQTIMKQSGGHIEVTSTLGAGSTFNVFFPRLDQPLDHAVRDQETDVVAGGTELVMIVEDDPSLRHLAAAVLSGHGYRVLRASNGQEGLRVANNLSGPLLSLVITDVVMPQMGGVVMAEWLRVTYPGLKILFTSGYTDDAVLGSATPGSGVSFLPKPYTPSTLARRVRSMLDETPGESRGGQ